ncbi:MAG: response regulator [Rhodospirillaceae bacterium]|nr:response regulator [Rhodospirillaceae bacterium]
MSKALPPSVVFVVDDDHAFRDSLALMLRLKGFVTDTSASGEEFLAKYKPGTIGCLLVDMQMGGMSGLDLQKALAERGSTLPVIVITAYGDVATARAALKAGAVDFLEKPLDEQALERIVAAAVEKSVSAEAQARETADVAARFERLTDRERQVFDLIVAGRHNREIAATLGISPRTVEVYKSKIMEKMRVTRLPELIRLAVAIPALGKPASS